jgi:hypothetical protein
MLRRRHHPKKETPGKAEKRQEANENGWQSDDSANRFPVGIEI